MSDDTYWTVRVGKWEHRLEDVAEYVRTARTYDLRLELPIKDQLFNCLNLSYYDKNDGEVMRDIESISGGHGDEVVYYQPTCPRLFFVPVKRSNKR
ncbi:hypothetical protein [Hymenobacter sp. BT730]|uniref:hypothetical protein n=1 Tax=Hymenobacter sp. BT730 TaxID=3063332 RepID=UPI0026DEF424|nr:hypothetical protein [Hymenobacter sp. BT730]